MKEKEYKGYKKAFYGYDKEFNNSKEYMTEFKPIEEKRNLLGKLKDWFDAPHDLTRAQVVFVASTIVFLATPEFAKFIVQSGVLAFLHYYGAAILAGVALFVLTRSDRK
jgi:hypothetical protein